MRGNPQGAGREWAAAAGIVFMHGVGMLADVQWDDRNLISAGLGFLVGLGGLFIPPDTLKVMPLIARLVLQQPVISGGLTLLILHAALRGSRATG